MAKKKVDNRRRLKMTLDERLKNLAETISDSQLAETIAGTERAHLEAHAQWQRVAAPQVPTAPPPPIPGFEPPASSTHGHGQGTLTGYVVEARNVSCRAEVVLGQAFDERWRQIETVAAKWPVGVPLTPHRDDLRRVGLYTLTEAQALRWLFVSAANAENGGASFCLQTRLVAFKVAYSYSSEFEQVVEPLDSQHRAPKERGS